MSLLVKVSAFLGTLHWPAGAVDFCVGGVSFVEMLILYELWAGGGFVLRVLFLSIGGLDVQFQCRLFLLVQALIFGAPVGFWVLFFVLCVCYLVVLVGFSLVFGILGGRSAVMVLRLGLVRFLLFGFWMSFFFFLGIQLPLVLVCLLGLCLLGIDLRVSLVRFLLGAYLGMGMLLVFLPLENLVGVFLVLCLLR